MKNLFTDIRFISGLIIAHFLMYFTFQDKAIFWYSFPATMLLLISFAIINEKFDSLTSKWTNISYGAVTGIVLFGIFWLGFTLIDLLNLPLVSDVSKLYNRYAPVDLWHYLMLFIIIIPGEEIFWRGFIQTKILRYTNINVGILISAILYASVSLYSGQWILAFASLVAGLFFGYLYTWKKSMPLIIISHLIFDMFLFVILPLG